MKSTKQVRAFIRAIISGNYAPALYTNKVKDLSTRHVKIYANDLSQAQQTKLMAFAGKENVRFYYGRQGYIQRSAAMIIKCAYKE